MTTSRALSGYFWRTLLELEICRRRADRVPERMDVATRMELLAQCKAQFAWRCQPPAGNVRAAARQVRVSEFHLVMKITFARAPVLGSVDAAALVGVEQRMIQPQDGNQGCKTQLAGLEDQIAVPQALDESPLRPVGLETASPWASSASSSPLTNRSCRGSLRTSATQDRLSLRAVGLVRGQRNKLPVVGDTGANSDMDQSSSWSGSCATGLKAVGAALVGWS